MTEYDLGPWQIAWDPAGPILTVFGPPEGFENRAGDQEAAYRPAICRFSFATPTSAATEPSLPTMLRTFVDNPATLTDLAKGRGPAMAAFIEEARVYLRAVN